MLEAFKFAFAAVARGPQAAAMPTLSHFRIQDGRLTAANGILAVSVPVPIHLDCLPHAGALMKALEGCEKDAPAFHMDGPNLVVRAGAFKTVVKCGDASRFPDIRPGGQFYPVSCPVLPVLAKVLPFMGTDEARAWSCGVLFSGQTVSATNNVSMIQAWLGVPFPAPACLPAEAVRELLRLKMEPVSVQVSQDRVTFHLPGEAWISSALSAREWPDLEKLFAAVQDVPVRPMPPELLPAVARLQKFTNDLDKVYFGVGGVSTGPPQEKDATTVETPASPGGGIYRLGVLMSLQDVATTVGFDNWPRPVPFYGENIRGCFIGFTA